MTLYRKISVKTAMQMVVKMKAEDDLYCRRIGGRCRYFFLQAGMLWTYAII